MTLSSGTRLGPYEIVAAIGAGGMGEVYRARDTRLDRIVAIKVISSIAESPDVRQRFEREARTLSTLNHPHICTIHDVGREGNVEYLVLEFVEGETLAARLDRGPMSIDEVIRRGIELASALDRAHRAGIIHRDLKPANVMLTKGGVKVLDFGLARFKAPEAPQSASVLTMQSPGLTGQGMILGTLQYMSPEQLDGREVDARSDIFALGAVLYEMAAGRRAFEASSHASLIAAILERDPPPIVASGRSGTISPAALDRIVRRCLVKDPDDRWQSARDLVIELEALRSSGASVGTTTPRLRPSGGRPAVIAAVAALLIAVASAVAAFWYARASQQQAPELRLEIVTPPSPSPIPLALSPDGRHVTFIATPPGGTNAQLWLRSLDTIGNQRLAGTEGADFPFWSADSHSIAFFADGKLKRYDVAGGAVRTLAPAALGRGGTWNRDGIILYAPSVGPLFRLHEAGGQPAPLTTVAMPSEVSHRFPQFLPDGRRFLYYVQGNADAQGVYLASLDEPKGRRLFQSDVRAVLVPPETLLFLRQGSLLAQRFDPAAAAMVGDAVRIADAVAADTAFNSSAIAASDTGLIAYRAGSANELSWVDRAGKTVQKLALPESGSQNCPELSADGLRLAMDRTVAGNRDVWIFELARSIITRFTVETGIDATPIWSPDGKQVLFRSNRNGVNQLYVKPASGAGTEEHLKTSDLPSGGGDWSPDGKTILFSVVDPASGVDLWGVRLDGDRKPFPVVKTAFEERDPQFSPDGKWIAFASNESGRMEIYVQAFPHAAGKAQVSANGGTQVRWRRDGRELFYLAFDGMLMSVPIDPTAAGQPFNAGVPVALFPARVSTAGGGLLRQQYAVRADGQRFLVNAVSEQAANAPITIIANWPGLKR
jgi:eukaryotic-like serine/threonine-protein kinase